MKLQQLFVDQLMDIYWAEENLSKLLPKLEEAAGSDELKQAFSSHLQETKNHLARLEKVFGMIDTPAEGKKCAAIAGIADEGQTIIDGTGDGTAGRDIGLIFVSRKAEHYEIATYSGLVPLARTLGYTDAAETLSVTLAEEQKADGLLTRLANTLEPIP
ncbi:MAG TPA: ferritin-like domain-containing protein [Puia sp.]|nr:ferritin-like domain-containing protein [Puia sp.]